MVIKYSILYNILNNKFINLNLNYLIKFKYVYFYKIYIFYPLLVPRCDSIFIKNFFLSIFNFFLLFCVFDLGSGSGFVNILFKFIFNLNFYSIDYYYLNYKLYKINRLKKIYIFSNYLFFFYCIKKISFLFSNPPYISFSDNFYKNSLGFHECFKSLSSSYNGLFDLYNIVNKIYYTFYLFSNILFEHGYNQSKKIRKFFYLSGFINIFTQKDLNCINRLTYAEK